ncbi:arginine--tRNA ligase [Egibacter rhizosphaerae]|uniref:Arginine--tRNA ligase n=1 Tax=Egibacter rhizosphaerae TaxID=1670831 RepID=A0A411YD26_9ACTN|nr:arginine--tRNA ligase [Egibacter rhizosphaerae]QBI19141.1 arginine--tRNA ligase [Egibacter rhizosphaerae]
MSAAQETAHLADAIRAALASAGLPDREPELERPRQREHGDWATNVAMTLAREVDASPREIAQRIVEALGTPTGVAAVEIAGPGFINFRLAADAFAETVRAAVHAGEAFGRGDELDGQHVNVEFVSANPTGPLHLGAGRWAAVGDGIASVLEARGADVTREYYFNDAGEQMRKFGASVEAALAGQEPPEDGYQGEYITELAAEIRDGGETQDVAEAAYQRMLSRITATLERFGVTFDVFFGERALHGPDGIAAVVAQVRETGHAYEAEGATWLRTTAFGDDKDRVLVKADGVPTYFAADCAYLADKLARGFDRCIYLLGADHHGYVKRLEAAEQALSGTNRAVEVIIGQLVTFLRHGDPVRMSKRAGDMVWFDDLLDEVGVDAARYTLLRTSIDQPLEFDLAEVVKAERENPVYYVQYSSARIAGILRTAAERGVEPGTVDEAPLDLLTHSSERELVRQIGRYPEVLATAAEERAPYKVARHAETTAEAFHKFYTECQVVSDDPDLTRARYWLVVAARQALTNALGLLGVTAPERM